MNSVERYLLRIFVSRSLRCPCPQLVPRSGEAGAKVNCFTVYIDKGTKPHLMITGLSGDLLTCLEWTGSSFKSPVELALDRVNLSDLSVTHFYGYSEVQYGGLLDLVVGRTLFIPYIKIHLRRTLDTTDQYFFNKKKLVTKQRIDLLRFLVASHLDGNPISNPIALMTGLYSIKWVLHPDGDPQQRRLRFYLDSLVDTGELRKMNHEYELTGEALKAIEIYEEQERQHTENVKIQRRIAWLTFAIALLTGAQAGLFKLPTLLDLSIW